MNMMYAVYGQRYQIPAPCLPPLTVISDKRPSTTTNTDTNSSSLKKDAPICRQVLDKMTIVDEAGLYPFFKLLGIPGSRLRVDCVPHQWQKYLVPGLTYLYAGDEVCW
jgi:hypothetical protein